MGHRTFSLDGNNELHGTAIKETLETFLDEPSRDTSLPGPII